MRTASGCFISLPQPKGKLDHHHLLSQVQGERCNVLRLRGTVKPIPLMLMLSLFLTACGGSAPTQQAVDLQATVNAAVATQLAARDAANPTATVSPTTISRAVSNDATATLPAEPASTPALEVTATPEASVVLSATPTRAATRTPKPTPTSTPRPSPVPTYTAEPEPTSTLRPTNTAAPTPATVSTLYVDAPEGFSGANIRANPNPDSTLLGEAANGDAIQVIGEPVEGTDGMKWYRVRHEGQDGYVRARALSSSPPDVTVEPSVELEIGKYTFIPPGEFTAAAIVGYVTNTGNTAAENVQIVASLENASGKTVATGESTSHLDIIGAGEKSPFYAELQPDKPPKYAKVVFDLSAQPRGSDEFFYGADAEGLVIQDATESLPEDEFDYYTITGRVRNTGDKPAEQVEVIAILYDQNDNPISLYAGYTQLDRLAPGRTSPFSVEFLFLESPESVKRFEVYVQGYEAD